MDTKQLLPRGVYEMPLISPNGCCCAVAVNSRGEWLGWLWYAPDGSEAAFRALWLVVDEKDPLPLRLVS